MFTKCHFEFNTTELRRYFEEESSVDCWVYALGGNYYYVLFGLPEFDAYIVDFHGNDFESGLDALYGELQANKFDFLFISNSVSNLIKDESSTAKIRKLNRFLEKCHFGNKYVYDYVLTHTNAH